MRPFDVHRMFSWDAIDWHLFEEFQEGQISKFSRILGKHFLMLTARQ